MPSASSQSDGCLLVVELVGLELGGCSVALLEHVARPVEVSFGAFFLDLAGLNVLADELQILGINSIAIFGQTDLGHLEDGLRLVNPGFGFQPADKLGL